jgi:hypothetical protein
VARRPRRPRRPRGKLGRQEAAARQRGSEAARQRGSEAARQRGSEAGVYHTCKHCDGNFLMKLPEYTFIVCLHYYKLSTRTTTCVHTTCTTTRYLSKMVYQTICLWHLSKMLFCGPICNRTKRVLLHLLPPLVQYCEQPRRTFAPTYCHWFVQTPLLLSRHQEIQPDLEICSGCSR